MSGGVENQESVSAGASELRGALRSGVLTIYTPDSPLKAPFQLVVQILREIWQRRELTLILLQRDLKAQFRQSLLGYAWLVLPPLINALFWSLMHTQEILRVSDSDSYAAFVLVGTTIWAAFSATLSAPSDVIQANREVFVKLNVPVESFILAGAGRAIFNLMVTSAVLLPLLLWQGIHLRYSMLLFPFAAGSAMLSAFTIGMALAPVGALYSDLRNALTPLLNVLMFTAPVVFPVPEGNGILASIVRHSPLTPAIALSRDVLLTGQTTWLLSTFLWLIVNLSILLLGFVGLRIARPHIIARMGM